jgi:hypothetical protein
LLEEKFKARRATAIRKWQGIAFKAADRRRSLLVAPTVDQPIEMLVVEKAK